MQDRYGRGLELLQQVDGEGGALNCGLSKKEVIEVFTQLIPYVGFPRVLNAISWAREVFA